MIMVTLLILDFGDAAHDYCDVDHEFGDVVLLATLLSTIPHCMLKATKQLSNQHW